MNRSFIYRDISKPRRVSAFRGFSCMGFFFTICYFAALSACGSALARSSPALYTMRRLRKSRHGRVHSICHKHVNIYLNPFVVRIDGITDIAVGNNSVQKLSGIHKMKQHFVLGSRDITELTALFIADQYRQ